MIIDENKTYYKIKNSCFTWRRWRHFSNKFLIFFQLKNNF